MSAAPIPAPAESPQDGLVRLLAVAFRRYARDPSTRATAARHILAAAINLHAEHEGPGETALAASEALAELARRKRRGGR